MTPQVNAPLKLHPPLRWRDRWPEAVTLVLLAMTAGVVYVRWFVPPATDAGLLWHTDLAAAQAEAAATGKPIFAGVTADWCPPCRMLEEKTFAEPRVARRLKDFALLKVDVDAAPELASQFSDNAVPTLTIAAPDGTPLARRVGFMGPGELLDYLDMSQSMLQAYADPPATPDETAPDSSRRAAREQ